MRLVRLNILCLAGASLGALSLFLTWVEILTSNIAYCAFEDMSVVDILGNACHFDLMLRVACLLFLIGVVLAFVTAAGAVFESVGVSVFFVWYATATGSLFSGDVLPGSAGAYAGMASAILVILALVRPVGIGYDGTTMTMKERLLAVALSWSVHEP